MERLREVGLLPDSFEGWEDDLLFERGVGFADMVKRPTPAAREIRPEEYEYGVPRLAAKLEMHAPSLVIFSFEMAAPRYFGHPVGCGFLEGVSIGTAEVFVMPWVRKGAARATKALASLADWVKTEP